MSRAASPLRVGPGVDGEDLMESQRIAGRYLVLRAIGRGGMGTVWLCRDEVLGREVAVKQIGAPAGRAGGGRPHARCARRARPPLNHANAVGVRRRRPGRPPWLVMEYVDGQSLAEMIPTRARCPPLRVAAIGAAVASALAGRTSAASCTATSSPATSSSTGAARPRSATSASPAATPTTSSPRPGS